MSTDDPHVLDYWCPKCGVPPGAHCKAKARYGRPMKHQHRERTARVYSARQALLAAPVVTTEAP